TLAMDDYDIGEGRGGVDAVLSKLTMPALVLGIDTDVLYPEAEAKALAERLPSARYARIVSPHGHDAFLIEFDQVSAHLRRFLASGRRGVPAARSAASGVSASRVACGFGGDFETDHLAPLFGVEATNNLAHSQSGEGKERRVPSGSFRQVTSCPIK